MHVLLNRPAPVKPAWILAAQSKKPRFSQGSRRDSRQLTAFLAQILLSWEPHALRSDHPGPLIDRWAREARRAIDGGFRLYALMAAIALLPCLAEVVVWQSPRAFLIFLLLVTAIAALGRILRPPVWIFLPFQLLSLALVAFMVVTRRNLNFQVFASLYETNPREVLELAGSPFVLLPALCIAALGGGLVWFMARVRPERALTLRERSLLAVAVVGCMASLLVLHGGRSLSDFYPFSFVVRHADYLEESRKVGRFRAQLYEYEGPERTSEQPETHVLVIGESLRAAALSAYGYERDTTPLIDQWHRKIVFESALSVASLTRVAVPSMLSLGGAADFERYYEFPSVLKVFREAGFSTYVASNQESETFWDYLPAAVLADAQKTIRLPDEGIARFDLDLLPVVTEFLAEPAEQKFIVVHLNGSHWRYDERYPATEAVFGTATYQDRYDNSVRYGDRVLGQIVETVLESPGVATVTFMPDHGEEFFNLRKGVLFHGVNGLSVFELHVPLLFFYNQAFAESRPQHLDNLRRNRRTLLTQDSLSHTLLGLAELYDSSVYDPQVDLSSPGFAPYPLVVLDGDNHPVVLDRHPVLDLLAVGSSLGGENSRSGEVREAGAEGSLSR